MYATSRVLKSAGYHVLEATTGAEAIEAAPQADLIVLDINLPDIDGFEVCRRLREMPETAQLPILHLSATFTENSDVVLGLEAGADSYLTRPVEAPVLLATVRTLLYARHADFIRRGLDAKLRTMFKLAPIAIAMLDRSFRFESVNPGFCSLSGYAPEELVGFTAAMIIGEQAKDFESAAAEGRLTFPRKDGLPVQVEWRLACEDISRVRILVMNDISYQFKAECEREELLSRERAARADAERSNRLKEEFLATLSHELRNPLNAILGWATVLGRLEGLPANALRGLQAIERNSKIQAQMIADLLDYAGIAFGKMRLAIVTVDPLTAVRAALEVVAASAAARQVDIDVSLECADIAVEADPSRLQQVVWNILSNAIKFSPDGGRVQLIASREGDSFCLLVRDHGKGISPAFLPHIFERFSQQDSSSTKNYGGLGIGLAIVKQLVELHGGAIQAHSDGEGCGATFRVSLPLSAKVPLPALGDSQRVRSFNLSGVIALVVEDDSDARELTKRILSDAGARVIEAQSAEAALHVIGESGANVLISDIGMAGKDGYQLVRTLRELGYGPDVLPAIALTAFARLQDRADALASGFQDHVVKPIDPSALVVRVNSLRRRRAKP